ncbi:hypothetical protein CJ030_MR5G010376 [Morella rubra]|uniref:Uncharacterized protein n=1 Tax=Morella rubra TaxID=262757 RepID=A0A6A1VR61_9ROSI|nr:hypothetical protein CJ030_MR5G010376 [Morella rubra]
MASGESKVLEGEAPPPSSSSSSSSDSWKERVFVPTLLAEHKRRLGPGSQRRSESPLQNSEWDGKQEVNGLSASEDVEPDTSAS